MSNHFSALLQSGLLVEIQHTDGLKRDEGRDTLHHTKLVMSSVRFSQGLEEDFNLIMMCRSTSP